MSHVPVLLTRGRTVVARSLSNEFGEFQVEYEPQSALQLHIPVTPGRQAIRLALTELQGTSPDDPRSPASSSRRRGRDDQIGLAAQKSRNLEEIDDLRDKGAIAALMHVGRDREACGRFDVAENRQCGGQSDAARTGVAGAVRLVVARLIYDGHADAVLDGAQRVGDLDRMVPRFDLAGPGDQDERQVVADR